MNKALTIVKNQLYQTLQTLIDQRVDNAQNAMQSAESSKSSQTKSSAGDKFETSRAMMQAEEDRNKVQLGKALALQNDLAKVNRFTNSETAVLGSLVVTNQGAYFLSIGIGKVKLDKTTYFAISLESPIGQLLFGKKVGEKVSFRGKTIIIEQLI